MRKMIKAENSRKEKQSDQWFPGVKDVGHYWLARETGKVLH